MPITFYYFNSDLLFGIVHGRNPSYWGKLCFLSTPDGENCGLVKNLAITALVSSKISEPILDKLVSCGMEKLDQISVTSLSKMDKVFLNGDWIGVCLDSKSFVVSFKHMRRAQLIDSQVLFFSFSLCISKLLMDKAS